MNINKVLILVWILFSAVLVIENMVIPLPAYVFIWNSHGWMLAILSIFTWMMIWYGMRWASISDKDNDDDFDF